MTNRRRFLKDVATATGVVFTGCCLQNAPMHAQAGSAPKRRQVMVGGRRVRTVDVHAHVISPRPRP